MALTDLGMFASIPSEEEDQIEATPAPAASVPLPRPRPDTPAEAPVGPVTSQGNGSDLGMFADIPDDDKPDPFAGEDIGTTIGRRGQQFAKGATEPIASVPEAVELGLRAAQGFLGVKGEKNIEDTAGFKLAENTRNLIKNFVGTPDPRDDSFWAQVAEGAGNVGGMAASAVTAGVLTGGIGALVVGGVQGASMNSSQVFKEAREAGASEEAALQAAGIGGIVGLSEIIPITHALKIIPAKFRTAVVDGFFEKLIHVATSAGEEGVQEYASQVANNLIAKGYYDPQRGWDEGALEAGLVGGLIGGSVGTIGSLKSNGEVEEVAVGEPDLAEKAALTPDAINDNTPPPVDAEPETLDPAVTEAMETPADRAKRISKERARKVLQGKRAVDTVAAAGPEAGAADLVPTDALTSEAATGNEAGAAAPVPGADTTLNEDLEPPQLAAAPVTSEGNPAATDAAPEETIPTVPESPETIELQREALTAGKRMAVLYPWGTQIPPEMSGTRIRRLHIPSVGIIDYDSRQINGAALRGVAKLGKLNEVLGLGPANKAAVAQSIEAGSPEVAVTERTPEGVEVKAAAGTEELAPEQVQALEEGKAEPENVVQVETPAEVIEARQEAPPAPEVAPVEPEPTPVAPKATKAKKTSTEKAAPKAEKKPGPTLIPDLRPEAQEVENQWKEESQYMRERARAANKAGTETAGKNWQAEQREDRARNNDSATKAIVEYAPIGKTEDAYLGRDTNAVNSRAVIKARASAMVEAAEKAGVKIPERVKDGKDDTMNHNEAVVVLMEARALARKESPGRDDYDRFVTRERLARGGERAQVVSERRSEGDQKKSTSGAKNTDNIAGTVTAEVTPENEEVVSAAKLDPGTGDDDVQTKAGKSARMGVRGLNSEGAASGEKLDADTKKRLIAEMNAKLAGHVDKEVAAIDKALPQKKLSREDDAARRKKLAGDAMLAASEKGISNPTQVPIEVVLSTDNVDVHTLADNILKKIKRRPGRTTEEKLQDDFIPLFLRRAKGLLPDMAVVVVSDEHMNLLSPGALAYYRPDTDFITVRESALDDYREFFHTFTHEVTHALFYHALEADPKLREQIEDLRDMVEMAADGGWRTEYGYTNAHEFIAEAWSNPSFQQKLAGVSVPREWWAKSGLQPPKEPALRTVLNWFKQRVAKLFAPMDMLMKLRHGGRTALDVALDVGGVLLELSPDARKSYYGTSMRMGVNDQLTDPQRLALEDPPKTLGERLRAAGLEDSVATDVEELIKEEFGGDVTDDELAAIAGEFSKPVTSESDLADKVAATPPPGKPAVQAVASGSNNGKPTKVRAFFLKTMTLDFMRQKYSKLFPDGKGGSHLDTFIKWLQRRDAIVARVADPHDRNAAEYIEFSRRHPDEGAKLADLAMDATRFDVNLGPNADNSHLGVNSKRGLQAKQHLKDLNARYDALSAEAKKLFNQMTAAYRASHNEAKTKLAGNILDVLEIQLTPTQRADLITKVVNGKLTDADKATVGSPTVFRALKNAASLRAIHGAYFPQMRFGNHVVVTTEAVAKPSLTRLVIKGKSVPVTTEVTGNVVRFTADQTTHGVAAELDRQVSNYVAGHDLRSLRVSRRWRDRQTGEFVEKGDQKIGRDYDLTYEVELQNKGVHYFESKAEARKFAKASTSAKTSPILERRAETTANVALEGTDVSAIVRRIDGRTDLSSGERSAMKRALEEAVVSSMPGNRSPARYQARRNVLGASRDIGRAAATYGKAQGNFIATLETAPKMREAMKGLGETEADVYATNAGAVSQVMNELRRRVEGIENPDEPNELAQTIATISFFDKLASPAASVVNAMQVTMNAGPVLGGRYGNTRSAGAILSAYHRMGAIGTIGRGVGAAAKSIAQWRRSAIDTSDILGSVRKKLGPKYDDLLNELISRGALDENAGFEIAQAVMEKKGVVRKNIARFDRAVRQLPNAVEVVNRVVTAVATYDLATGKGKTPAAAIQEAFDTVVNTQGDYRAVNTPRFMKQGLLSFAMQFRKFALLQTQLYADMFARITYGATPKEKLIAAKQMMNLMAMQVLVGGAMGLPGLELVKVGVTLAGMLGLSDDDWEDWERKMQDLLAEVTGKDWANLIANGIVTRAAGIDVSTRMSQADLWTGFSPKTLDADGITQYVGGIFLGAPGQTVVDWAVKAPQKLKAGDTAGALELVVPIKTLADTIKAWRKYDGEEYNAADAALQAFGFKSARQADADAQSSRDYNDKSDTKKEADKLRDAYKAAKTNGEKARIKGLIRDYNKRKKPDGVFNIDLDRLTKTKETSP